MVTNIYIEIDSTKLGVSRKKYGYLIEAIIEGVPYTVEEYGEEEGTLHKVTLTALEKSLARFNRRSEICLHGTDIFILNVLCNDLARMAEVDFTRKTGKPMANREEWIRIAALAGQHTFTLATGKHEYTSYMQTRLRGTKCKDSHKTEHLPVQKK